MYVVRDEGINLNAWHASEKSYFSLIGYVNASNALKRRKTNDILVRRFLPTVSSGEHQFLFLINLTFDAAFFQLQNLKKALYFD